MNEDRIGIHDDQCESEFLIPPYAYSPCGCQDRREIAQFQYSAPRPSLRRRISTWERWPWRPAFVMPEYPPATYTTVVKQNARPIACHHDDVQPWGFGVRPDRWSCLYGLVTGHLEFDFQVTPPDAEAKS